MKRISLQQAEEIETEEPSIPPAPDPGYIDHLFGPEGTFAKTLPGYSKRDGQVEMAHYCDDAIADRTILLAEGETGVGKSYAYLIPTIKSIAEYGGQAVVVTAGITLQEQIFKKDLPALRELLGFEFKAALAKGYSNYRCDFMVDVNDAKLVLGDKTVKLDMAERMVFDKVRAWQTENGDLSEFEIELPPAVKRLVTVSSEDCIKRKCNYFHDGCFPRMARKAFADADIVVTNYHLYFLDLELRRLGVKGLLPDHRILVWDECHSAAAIARQNFGLKLSFGSVKSALDALDARDERSQKLGIPKRINPDLKGQTEQAAEHFFDECLKIRNDPSKYRARLDVPGIIDGAELERLLRKASKVYREAAEQEDTPPDAKDWLRKRSFLCDKQAGVILGSREVESEDWIHYIEKQEMPRGGARAALVREPLFPNEILRESLFEKNAEPRAIILTSATITTGSKTNPFGYISRQLGVKKFDESISYSPFDYSKTVLVVPKGIPDPSEPAWLQAVGEKLIQTVQAARGRTLGLFTSYRGLESAHAALKAARLPYKILRQGEAPRTALIKAFKEDPASVLLGTASLWTGVDVPGESLLAVFMDKLPFDPADDPVLDAVKEAYPKDWFKTYYQPRMIITMKQGFGRLIRGVDDRGAVVVCDRRIMKKGYGKSLIRALPEGLKVTENMDAVASFCWPE